jgi:hypothetical protein
LERSEVQLDAILEAYSVDHPKELKFERRKTREARDRPVEALKGWADVLIGKARDEFRSKVTFKIPDRYRRPAVMPKMPPPESPPTSPYNPRLKVPTPATPRPAPRRRQ